MAKGYIGCDCTILNNNSKKNNVDIVISLREFDPNYAEDLNRSIAQAESGADIISMTMEEFVAYNPKKKQ